VFPSTPAQWAHFLGGCGVKPTTAAAFAEPFAEECTPDRFRDPERELDDYMAQMLYESRNLSSLVEDLEHYSPARIRELGALFGAGSRWARAAASADALAGDGPALAEVLYGGRFGNARPGDGWLFRGQGLPQITFYDNFAWLGDLMGQDLTVSPHLLQQPRYAVQASLLFFRGKVPLSCIDHDDRVRRCVHGSTLGLDSTRRLAEAARNALRGIA
jgi:putative chitinase